VYRIPTAFSNHEASKREKMSQEFGEETNLVRRVILMVQNRPFLFDKKDEKHELEIMIEGWKEIGAACGVTCKFLTLLLSKCHF
jgi:hypothetical protein